MLFRILRDAYNFFDKHWYVIVAAAILSVGMADALSLIVRTLIPLPSITINSTTDGAVRFGYNDIIEAIFLFIGSVWFRGFIATLVHTELQSLPRRIPSVLKRSLILYPRVLMVNIAALIVVYTGVALAVPALMLGSIGIVFVIPALIFFIWFSLVSPTIVIDELHGAIKVLTRSRMLVTGYFWQVLLVHAIVIMPVIAVAGIKEDTIYFWPILVFINIITAILEASLITFTYVNLRLAKGEHLTSPVPVSEDIA